MDAFAHAEPLYTGEAGFATAHRITHAGRSGALVYYANPDPRKLHSISVPGLRELEAAVDSVIRAPGLSFCVFHGAYDLIHAGADITQFAGEPDHAVIDAHLRRGTELDARIKAELWPRLRTVGVLCGDRYGGSVEWLLFAEHAVAAGNTRLQFSEVQLGILPGWNGILNVLLRSHAANALYLGATGNTVNAERVLAAGLARRVVELPADPDRRTVAPEDWPAVWAEHAARCQGLLLDAALELAVAEDWDTAPLASLLARPAEIAAELARRQDPAPYRALRERLEQRLAALGVEPAKEALRELRQEAARGLLELGKPLAPTAVAGVQAYVERWGELGRAELLALYAEASQAEAELCMALMRSEHRRRGVDAVLSRSPFGRVTVFD
jgi:enoyl-CoA hydratase/carnithine racemase